MCPWCVDTFEHFGWDPHNDPVQRRGSDNQREEEEARARRAEYRANQAAYFAGLGRIMLWTCVALLSVATTVVFWDEGLTQDVGIGAAAAGAASLLCILTARRYDR